MHNSWVNGLAMQYLNLSSAAGMAQEGHLVRIEKYPYLKSSILGMPNSLVKN